MNSFENYDIYLLLAKRTHFKYLSITSGIAKPKGPIVKKPLTHARSIKKLVKYLYFFLENVCTILQMSTQFLRLSVTFSDFMRKLPTVISIGS